MSGVRVTADRLSDGREILYFDERDAPPRPRDARGLPPAAAAPAMRWDALLGEWVAIAAHRQDRTHLPPAEACPLCPSRGRRATEIPAADYDVVVFENRFPSFAATAAAPAAAEQPPDAPGPFRERPARGRCEVVCFTSDHGTAFSDLPARRVRTILEAWSERTAALSRLPYVEQVYCFENRGEQIGVTLAHPHGQIYAYPFVTPRSERMLARAREHRRRGGGNLFAELLAAELACGERVVIRGERWSAFAPFAARWPVEVHLYPHRRVADLTELSDDERAEFPLVYLDLLRRLEAVCGRDVPYVAAWHQAPVRGDRDLAHLHLELFSIRRAPDKLKYLAGSESGMGAFVNDLAPEQVAGALRDAAG